MGRSSVLDLVDNETGARASRDMSKSWAFFLFVISELRRMNYPVTAQIEVE